MLHQVKNSRQKNLASSRQPKRANQVRDLSVHPVRVKNLPLAAVAIDTGAITNAASAGRALEKLGFAPEQIFTTLEERMKCGIGKCGRCNVGHLYVCKDGPVFSYATLKGIPEAFA